MQSFSQRFREESWFKKVQGRSWPDVEKKIACFLKEECKKFGGHISKDTSTRDYQRIKTSYESLFFGIVNDLLKKDVGVKNGLYAAMGAGASQLGEGHVYWMKDMVGDDPAYQAEYNALTPREQQCATHLQTLTRYLMLYSCEMIISPAMKSRVVELYRGRLRLSATKYNGPTQRPYLKST